MDLVSTLQAKVALVAGLVVVFMAAIVSISYANYFNLLSIVLFTVPLVILIAFDINCVIVGQCETLGWFKTLVVVFLFAVAFYAQAVAVRDRVTGGPTYARAIPLERMPARHLGPADINDSLERRNHDDTHREQEDRRRRRRREEEKREEEEREKREDREDREKREKRDVSGGSVAKFTDKPSPWGWLYQFVPRG